LKKFKVFVHGKNYLIREAGNSPRKLGFYTTAFVEACNAEQAEAVALELLRNDSKLRDASENQASDPPRIKIESIEEIQSFDGCNLPRMGLAFYVERS
jgi:hypothetical protein